MRHNDVIRSVAWMTGTKIKDIAASLGISNGTLANSLSAGNSPSIKRFVDCVEACGYKVVVMRDEDTIPEYAIRVDGTKED